MSIFNTSEVPDQKSPWEMTHGKKFDGLRLPFGCLVYFKPSPTRDDTLKFGPIGHLGVFAGYFMAPGYKWSGNYLVWELRGFCQADPRADASKHHQRTPEPHVTQVVLLPEGDLQFPLKERYEKINRDTEDPDLGPDEDDRLVTDEQREKRAWDGAIPEGAAEEATGPLGVTPGLTFLDTCWGLPALEQELTMPIVAPLDVVSWSLKGEVRSCSSTSASRCQ